MESYKIIEKLPTATEFNDLREAVGWGRLDEDIVRKGLSGSIYALCIQNEGNETVGCVRLVGDNAMKVYVEELMVHPDHQGQGLGTELMKRIMEYIATTYRKGCTVGLFANTGLAKYYGRFGFRIRADEKPGMQYNP